MATVDKNFKVKHGLIVEGTTATVNGEDIITTGSSTDNLPEGSTNKYYSTTQAKSDAADLLTGANLTNITITGDENGLTITAENGGIQDLTGLSTTDLAEGNNLYFTDERAQDAVGNSVGRGLTYDDAAGEIKVNINNSGGAIGTHPLGWLEVKTDDTTIWTGGSGNQLMVKTGEGSPVASKTYVSDSITTHAEDTSTHGVTGDIVGTTDAQSLSNKTFKGTTYFQSGGGAGGTNNSIDVDGTTGKLIVESGYALDVTASGDVKIQSGNANIVLDGDTGVFVGSTTAGNEVATHSHVDNLIGDNTVDGTAGNTITDRIETAVANLVDGAPALLDTLNELAAAINDDASYATTVTNALAGKQKSLTAGNGILLDNNGNISVKDGATTKFVDGSVEVDYANGLTTNIDGKLAVRGGTGISVTEMGGVSLNTSIFASGLEQNMNGQIVVDTDTIASKNYVDTNFVNVNDLPGQLDDYVPLTDKGAANGVATLDGSGQVPLNQLGNVPAAYITSVGTNLDVSAGQLTVASTPTFTAVDINSIAKQVATTATASMASVVNVLTWNKADYRSAKLLVKASTASHTQVSEIILSLDSSDNVAITEFGIVYTDGELGQVTADVSGTDVRVRVTTLYPSTDVSVVGTLLA